MGAVGYLGLHGLRSTEEGSPAPVVVETARSHGADMGGAMASSLVDGRWACGDSAAAIFRSIAAGIETDGMPAFGAVLTTAEIEALAALMRAAESDPR